MNPKPTPPGRAVHRSLEQASGEMRRRLRGLLEPKAKVAGEIHALRKLGKLVRGGMHLLGMSKREIEDVSSVGRLLGAPRDAASRLTTWRRLELDTGPEANEPSVRAIQALLEANAKAAAQRPPRQVVVWAGARLRQVRVDLKTVPTGEWEVRVEEGRRKLTRRLVKRLARLEHGHPSAQVLHRARKVLKAWLGALHHLGERPPESLVALADLLGDINDLHTLGAWLEAHGFSRRLAPLPWRAIEEKLVGLEAAAVAEAPVVRALLETES